VTTLVFNTPSRYCPYRQFNGRRATIVEQIQKRPVKRLGWRVTPVYRVIIEPDWQAIVLADELFIEGAQNAA
jgi:hypothetical protein